MAELSPYQQTILSDVAALGSPTMHELAEKQCRWWRGRPHPNLRDNVASLVRRGYLLRDGLRYTAAGAVQEGGQKLPGMEAQ